MSSKIVLITILCICAINLSTVESRSIFRVSRDLTALQNGVATAAGDEDMELAESSIFLPIFRYKSIHGRRGVQNIVRTKRESTIFPKVATPADSDDMEVAESSIFLPIFRYKSFNGQRPVRVGRDLKAVQNADILTVLRNKRDAPTYPIEEHEDMEVAESSIFLPIFRYKSFNERRRVRN